MYHHFPEYYLSVSERVSNILDVVGYSQEDRDRKVMSASVNEFFVNITKHFGNKYKCFHYIFGSRGDGCTGPGLSSDQDILFGSDEIQLVTDLPDCQPDKVNLLMVHDIHTHPGYLKLQPVKMLPDNTPVPLFHHHHNHFRVDSYDRNVLENQLDSMIDPGDVFSGPARRLVRDRKENCVDNVYAMQCTQWPNKAQEWFQRRRSQGWPNSHQLQNARKDGCFAVGVGHPHSHEYDLEWRLSFSFTERKLTRSFEDTVMKVYALLKMIKKTYIEPVLGDAFSSYHCKVCMLWVRERTPTELWRTENLIYCLTLCIKQLYEWASEGYCPDYFIVTNNIYDRKIFGTAQLILTKLLGILVSDVCRMMLGLECCNLGELLLYDCNRLDIIRISKIINTQLRVETYVDYSIYFTGLNYFRKVMLGDIPPKYNIFTSYIISIMHALQHPPHTYRIYLHHVLMMLLSQLGFHVVSVCKENAYCLSQEEGDYLMAFASRCLSLGINCDATSVRLKLCGLGTMLGDCDVTEICLQHMSDHNMRYMFSSKTGGPYGRLCSYDIITNKYSPEELLQNQMSFSVIYLRSETPITPTPLKMEMFRSIGARPAFRDPYEPFWYECADVDSLLCLYFFQYLNFCRLGKVRHQQAALDNMIHVIRTELIPHIETELNLLGYCFMRETQFIYAFVCFNKSLKRCPHHNAAKFYLGILFRKIHIARLRCHRK